MEKKGIREIKYIYHDRYTDEYFPILKLKFKIKNKDIYFVDLTFDYVHISFHNDGNICVTNNGEKISKSKCLISKSWDKIKFSPLFLYVPMNRKFLKPVDKLKVHRSLDIIIEDEPSNYIFKFFLVGDNSGLDKKIERNRKFIQGYSELLNGTIEDFCMKNRIIEIGEMHRLYITVDRMIKPVENKNEDERLLVLFEVNNELDLEEFLKENKINSKEKTFTKLFFMPGQWKKNNYVSLIY